MENILNFEILSLLIIIIIIIIYVNIISLISLYNIYNHLSLHRTFSDNSAITSSFKTQTNYMDTEKLM